MIITNGTLITWGEPNRILEGQAVRVSDGSIAELGPQAELLAQYPQEERLDAAGQYVMPGNICAHTHFYGAFARGMAIPGPAPKDFPEILQKLWWPLDKSLRPVDVRFSALVMLADAIKHGTTTLIDHHASPDAIDGSLDVIAGAVEESGARAVLCYEVTDRDGDQKAQAGIQENLRFIDRTRKEKVAQGRVAATFGLHASLTLSEETLTACREAAPGETGFHIHVAEHEADEYDSLAKSGLRIVDRLQKHEILGPKTIVAHAVHVDAREISLLAQSGTWVSHQPRSNMNNGVGVAQVESLMRAGASVCLGTDGFSHIMWEEWKTAYLLHKVWHRDPRRMSGTDVAQMAAYNNARLAEVFFHEGPLGVLAPGALADIIFIDYHPQTPVTPENLPWHIIFGFHESMVTTTIVAGKVLMKDRQLLTLDEGNIAARARELASKVWERYETHVPRA
ncbi:MAG TPA: putative aminohydrolase SsnA [Anaerolineales bacterium]|nr:putative aminohydrolase SsnA [Anaerolineales bacterium]